MVLEDGIYNADRSTTCFQNFPIPPCALAKPELPITALRACRKIDRDHLAHLVSSNREDFAYYQYNEKTILLLYAGEFRVPPRVPGPCTGILGGGGQGGAMRLVFHLK